LWLLSFNIAIFCSVDYPTEGATFSISTKNSISSPKVLSRRDKQITINWGDGTDISVGQIWNVFVVGEELIDPDTKESLGREEVLVGKAKITSVLPKTSTAEILEDYGIDKMAILRKAQ
ncbi:MAG: hypothetical protein NUV74_16475, partial [Candidatus Brocadiaceae bacterium]|nr:hypothetical protein [Candidatus Brocadiaceae bacterium]